MPEEGSRLQRNCGEFVARHGGELVMDVHVGVDSPSKPIDALFVENSGAAKPLEQWAAKRVTLTLNQFSSFAAVAKHLSLTKASLELRVSQPSITQQLKQLEDHHGTQLYRRLSKGIEITEAGQLFLRKIMPILEQVAKLEGGFKPPAPKCDREILRVGGTDNASAELLPSLLADFRHMHPTAELEMRTRTSDQLERMLLNSGLDLAVTVREVPSVELACESLRHEKVVMFVRADHRLAKTNKLKPSEVLVEPLIVRGGRGASGVVDKALNQIRDQGLEFKVAMYCDGPTEIKAAVRQKMGVGIVFEAALKAEVASGEFKILKVCGLELEGESFIVYSKKRPLSPLAQEFLELLRSARQKTETPKLAAQRSVQSCFTSQMTSRRMSAVV
jgi:DNA-binding transcriptional LysR family regulator